MSTRNKKNNKRQSEYRDSEGEESKTIHRPLNMGKLAEFNVNTEDWCVYEELLEQFFHVNAIDDGRKVSVLLTSIGTEAYKYLRDLCIPDLPKDKTFSTLCDIMRSQFSRKLSIFRERVEFYEMKQELGDSVKTWYARVKKQAATCSFGNRLDDVLKDRFVCGLLEGPIKDLLCEEQPNVKTLNQFYELALAREMNRKTTVFREIAKVSMPKFKDGPNRSIMNSKPWRNLNDGSCTVCGGRSHESSICRYKDFRCRLCREVGHLQRMCSKKRVNVVEKEVDVENGLEDEFSKTMHSVEVVQINHCYSVKPMICEVRVDGINLKMEIDTGSGISLIPYSIYEQVFKKFKPLEPTRVKLKSFSNEIIEPKGTLSVTVEWLGKSVACTLYVVGKTSQNLLGRDWLHLFDWPGLNNVATVGASDGDLQSLISDYSHLFSEEIGCYKFGKVSLKVKPDANPRFVKPRPIPFAYRNQVDDELDRLEKSGIIEKIDSSFWGTPLVPVLKENGQIRVCANYKITVNPYLEDVNHPLPRIEEIWAALQGGQEFTKLDFRQAYNQLQLDEETKMLLAWSTHKGVYKVNRLTFGSKPAVAIFQREVEKTLQGLKGVVNFLDDLIVTGSTRREHMENLRKVFDTLSRAGFTLNLEKCQFFKPEVRYLGHLINKNGIQKDPKKVEALLACPRPSNVSEVRSFVGVVNYFGKFIKRVPDLLEPLYKLLKKGNVFMWDEKCEEAFQKAKKEISSDQVLTHFDPKLPLCLYCDASNNGIAAVLLHEASDGSKRPIAFASRKLTITEKGYSTIHKEALAIYWGMTKFYQYLMGNKFTLYSDHKPLAAIFGEKKGIPEMAAGRLQRWSTYISGFDYVFRHVSSASNLADAISRMPVENAESGNLNEIDYVNLVSEELPVSLKLVKSETRTDPTLSKVLKYVEDGWPMSVDDSLKPYFTRKSELSSDSGVLMWGYRLVIPTRFRVKLLNELHTAHQGMTKMKSRARSYFWWPSLDLEIENYCKKCLVCMSTRPTPPSDTGKWPTVEVPFDRIHVDYAGPLRGKCYLVVTDAFSKWPEVCEVTSTSTEVTLRKLREIFARFGIPKVLVTDNGSNFTSREFEEFCKLNSIKHITTPPFHPSSNGAAENAVKTFKKSLLKHLAEAEKKKITTSTAISRYLFNYRISIHCATGETPARRMFGRELRNRLDVLREDDSKPMKAGKREIHLRPGEEVYVRDYRGTGTRWIKATVEKQLGEKTYMVRPVGTEMSWKRHMDQILKT